MFRDRPLPEADVGEFWNAYAQRAAWMRNLGGGRFEDATGVTGDFGREPRVGRALAMGDVDGDGDLDLLVTEITHAWAGDSSDRTRVLLREDHDGGARFATDPRFSLDRVPADPRRWNQGDLFGDLADLDHDGRLDVIVSSVPVAVMDLQVFRSVGIEPSSLSTIGLKSRNHFRAAYEPIAREVVLVDAGGIASMRLAGLPYRNIPRPIWPLDPL